MKKARHLNVLAFCTVALGLGVSACDGSSGTPVDEVECSEQLPCPDGLVCNEAGKCEVAEPGEPGEPGEPDDNINTDPCKEVNCPDGKSCLNAQCIDTECIVDGAEMVCDGGQMCSKGVCVDDGCQDKVCEEGKSCVKGVCEDTLCYEAGIVCNAGSTCVKGACVDNECLGMSCDEGLACSKGECMYPACVGKEACAEGKSCNEAGECVFDVAPALNAVADKNETDEAGGFATVSLSLNNAPTADVTVTCALSPENAAAEAEVNCEGIRFNAENYGTTQTVHVVGLADNVIDEDQAYTLTLTTVSEDAEFNGLSQAIEMVNKNVDTVGVSVVAEDLVTTEAGGSAVFSIALKAKPASDVTIGISSSNPEYGVIEGAVENKLTVTFTPENWETPQEIKVMGIDDGEVINEADHKYQVVFENTVSEDMHYNGLEIAPLDVLNLDNDVADVYLDKTEIVTEEGGDVVDIKVRLGIAPSENVYVSVKVFEKDQTTPSDELEVVSEGELALTKDNYKDGVTVSLRGVDDHLIDGDQEYAVQLSFATNDVQYKETLKEKWILGKNIDKNEAGLLKSDIEVVVSEDGTSSDIGLSLNVIPTAPVTLAITSGNKDEVLVAPATITFTPEDWNKEQIIKVTGADDYLIDGDTKTDIVIRMTSEDPTYGGDGAELKPLEETISIINQDNDIASIVTDAGGIEIMENSEDSLEYKISLSAKPVGNVTVISKSSDESELKVVAPNINVFTPSNWNVPQTVKLNVQDDSYADGTQMVTISMTTSAGDKNFHGLKAQTPYYSVLDNESASLTLTAAKTTFMPGDYTTTMNVALSALPLSDVVVTLSTTSDVTAALSEKQLTFTTENWNTPQTITITNKDPEQAASAKVVDTISAVASGKGQYDGLKSNDVVITSYFFEDTSVGYSETIQGVTLRPGKYKLEVWGGRGGSDCSGIGGYGGYAMGYYTVKDKETLYVVTGGVGGVAWADIPASYNGGGLPSNGTGSGGGGATHIATTNRGELFNYADAQHEVLIVAGGGGGGGDYASGGGGGGLVGVTGAAYSSSYKPGIGGTQTSGYAFGKGEPANGQSPAGGGGWYGGYRSQSGVYAGGGGGSGYIGGVTNGTMQTAVNNYRGYAKITLVE